jgi:hypothetical protein
MEKMQFYWCRFRLWNRESSRHLKQPRLLLDTFALTNQFEDDQPEKLLIPARQESKVLNMTDFYPTITRIHGMNYSWPGLWRWHENAMIMAPNIQQSTPTTFTGYLEKSQSNMHNNIQSKTKSILYYQYRLFHSVFMHRNTNVHLPCQLNTS